MSSQELRDLLHRSVTAEIDLRLVNQILSQPPFITISGAFNTRDIGALENSAIREGFAFRSGSLEGISSDGKLQILSLGIGVIFDMRSLPERTNIPPPEIENVVNVWRPSAEDTEPSGITRAFTEKRDTSVRKEYIDLLRVHAATFRDVLVHVLQHPEQPFLFHCNVGKHRTGVLAAILHRLAGSPMSIIAHDYALTRIGCEPVRPLLIQKISRDSGGAPVDLSHPAIMRMADCRPDVVHTLFEEMDRKYGGVLPYVQTELGFSGQEVAQIQANLTSPYKRDCMN